MTAHRRITAVFSAAVFCLALAAPARAELIDLGNGLIYDTVQDITWMQDAMYARTSGYDADGRLTYEDAASWTDGLSFAGFDDWRLPRAYSTGWWWDSDSEISRLLNQLGWRWEASDVSTFSIPDYLRGGTGPFMNLSSTFWLGENVWWSAFYSTDGADSRLSRAWAVRDGGNPEQRVPEPSALLLVALGGLLALAATRRRVVPARVLQSASRPQRG